MANARNLQFESMSVFSVYHWTVIFSSIYKHRQAMDGSFLPLSSLLQQWPKLLSDFFFFWRKHLRDPQSVVEKKPRAFSFSPDSIPDLSQCKEDDY